MMNYFNKIKMFVFCLFLVLCWSGYGLSPAFASKEKKISAKTGKVAVVKGSMAEKVAKPHAFFDTDKMSDMSDFDPASWVSPTGDTIKIGVITCFSGPGAFNAQIAWSVVTWVAHDINKRGCIWVDGKKKLIEIVRAITCPNRISARRSASAGPSGQGPHHLGHRRKQHDEDHE
jgi:hypothetical protein